MRVTSFPPAAWAGANDERRDESARALSAKRSASIRRFSAPVASAYKSTSAGIRLSYLDVGRADQAEAQVGDQERGNAEREHAHVAKPVCDLAARDAGERRRQVEVRFQAGHYSKAYVHLELNEKAVEERRAAGHEAAAPPSNTPRAA